MNMFQPTSAKTPEEYIGMLEEPRKTEVQKLFDFIKKVMPNEKPFIQSGMIGFKSFHYKSKSGREGDWPFIALASRKDYISLYVCAVSENMYVAEKYKNELPKADIGRSCIRFKKLEDLDLKVLEKIIKEGQKTGFQV
jgi:hypothetical protein